MFHADPAPSQAAPPAHVCVQADRGRFTVAERTAIVTRQDGLDWWTGQALPADFQIDHVLPWAWALCHGLQTGDVDRFYHDTNNLVATAGTVNRQKSDHVPWEDSWEPAVHRCWWAQSARTTIDRWHLTPTPDEAAALQYMLAACLSGWVR